MAYRTDSTPNLDFDDLVEALDQFVQEAQTLQDRIACFMGDARETIHNEALPPVRVHEGSEVQSGAAP